MRTINKHWGRVFWTILLIVASLTIISIGVAEEIDTSCGPGGRASQCNVSCNKSMVPCLSGCPDQPKETKWTCIENCRQKLHNCLTSCDRLCEGNEPNSPSSSTESDSNCLEWQATISWGGQLAGKTDQIKRDTRENCEAEKERVSGFDTPSTITDCRCAKLGNQDSRKDCWYYDMYDSGRTIKQPLAGGFSTQYACEEHLRGRKREGGSFGSSCYCKMENIQEAPLENIQKPESSSGTKSSNTFQKPENKKGSMVFVPAGEFWMGCNDRVDNECESGEKPYHKVKLDAYYIDKFEVTQGDYDQCVSAGKCMDNKKYDGFTSPRQPVVGVNWNDAQNYCEWAGKRLPTEAQWEKAARGTDGRKYSWGNQTISCSLCNYSDCKKGKTTEVGGYPSGASPYGALDMMGNAWEWVSDWSDKGYYASSPERNPTGANIGTARVLRGGCWSYDAGIVRASQRLYSEPSNQGNTLGFRCVGALQEESANPINTAVKCNHCNADLLQCRTRSDNVSALDLYCLKCGKWLGGVAKGNDNDWFIIKNLEDQNRKIEIIGQWDSVSKKITYSGSAFKDKVYAFDVPDPCTAAIIAFKLENGCQ